MALTRAIHQDGVRSKIAHAIISLCRSMNISVIAEGVETIEEAVALRELGIRLFQGYLFARPAVEELPGIDPSSIEELLRAHETMLLDPSLWPEKCIAY